MVHRSVSFVHKVLTVSAYRMVLWEYTKFH